ncbi:MAG: hypothetical protein J3T61_12115, partial [Candidatus Brocadiales bacterium]|nr:hypothetical protein [Candidatus Bathyanammoxibius sp.]
DTPSGSDTGTVRFLVNISSGVVTFENNIVVRDFSSGGSWTFEIGDQSTGGSGTSADRNAYSDAPFFLDDVEPGSESSWTTWRTAGQDANSIKDETPADVYTNAAAGDFTLPSGSNAEDLGQYDSSYMPSDGSFSGFTNGQSMNAGPYILGSEQIGTDWM